MESKLYEELKEKSNSISVKLIEKSKIINPNNPFVGKYMVPSRFNHNIKYLFMGVNPSIRKSGNPLEHESDDMFLCSLGRFEKTKLVKGLTYGVYFNRLLELVDFDDSVGMFWEEPNQFERIKEKYPHLKDELNKLGKEIGKGPKRNNFILFNELVYIRHTTQLDVQNIIKDCNELIHDIKELFLLQIKYYKPKVLIINNAFVSKFLLEYVYADEKLKTSHFDKELNVKIFFSGTMPGGRLDEYNFRRLKNELIIAQRN